MNATLERDKSSFPAYYRNLTINDRSQTLYRNEDPVYIIGDLDTKRDAVLADLPPLVARVEIDGFLAYLLPPMRLSKEKLAALYRGLTGKLCHYDIEHSK